MLTPDTLVADAQACYAAAVSAVRAERLLGAVGWTASFDRPLAAYRRVRVVAIGKAAWPMAAVVAAELERRVAAAVLAGVVVVPHGYAAAADAYPLPAWATVHSAGHPVPDADGARAAEAVLATVEACRADDAVLVLLSGGGSALLPAFAPGISLDDARRTFALLLRSGADIRSTNVVRKHVSRIAGGRLAAAAFPADVVTLVLSDVVGDDLATVASGPTAPDPSTFADAIAVARAHGLWDALPASVRDHLRRGLVDPSLETPKPGDPALSTSRTLLVGSNRQALDAARDEARRRGYDARIVSHQVTGEARQVGRAQVRLLLDAARAAAPRSSPPLCLLWGGETTVTVRGPGRGGRNQELALAAALALHDAATAAVLLAAGTDGIDGPTDAAGAWATPDTLASGRRAGYDAAAHLAGNDAYTFFDAVGGLLRPGPTHTNVMDVQVGLAGTP